MTLERIDKETEPVTTAEALFFAQQRMDRFWAEARRQAAAADEVKAQYLSMVTGSVADAPRPLRGADREKAKKLILRQAFVTEADALHAAFNDSAYKDAVALQAMYDRWAMREAAIVTALAVFVPKKPDGTPNFADVREGYRTLVHKAYGGV